MKWEENLEKQLQFFDLQAKDINLYRRAFSHASYTNEKGAESYECLEFLGDSILDLILSEYCYKAFPSADEGFLSKARSYLNTSSILAKMAEKLDFDKMFFLGRGQSLDEKGMENIRGDIFEAFIAAVYLENGLETVRRLLHLLYKPYFERMKNESLEAIFGLDYKTEIQEKLHEIYHETPKYKVDAEEKTKEGVKFKVSLYLGEKVIARAEAFSRKKAEVLCAKKAYEEYHFEMGGKS